jgi:2-polyprenyl-3-methyl-5-hydroxy-6-metoxy-1,4-benzoquinol methylase
MHSMDKDYGSERNFFVNRVTRPIHRQVNEYIFDFFYTLPMEIRVLDVGSGDGFFLFFLREFGFKNVRGIDLSHSFIERAQEKGLNVELADVLEYEPGFKFDLITMIELLEHIKDPEAVLRKVHGLLNMNGRILVTVPIFDSLSSRWDRLRGRTTRLDQCRAVDETHVHGFSREDILGVIQRTGFGIKEYRYNYNPLPYRFRQVMGASIYALFERITFFNTCGEGLFIIADKLNA